jgi:RNA polymerase subunit RPABC4/transcription elongation factor Spt4
MSKFCESCGAEINDEATVCPNCGATVTGAQAQAQTVVNETVNTETASTEKKGDVKKMAIIGGSIAAVVVVIVALLVSLIGGRYKSPIKKYVKGLNKCDAESYMAAYPSFLKMETKDKTLTERKKNLEKTYGDNVKYSYKVLKKTKISKDDLKKVKEAIQDKYKENVKVSKGFKVKVKQTIKGKKDYDYATDYAFVYKIDGKWYILDIDPEEL